MGGAAKPLCLCDSPPIRAKNPSTGCYDAPALRFREGGKPAPRPFDRRIPDETGRIEEEDFQHEGGGREAHTQDWESRQL